ncbi:G-protein coupled receptor [Lithospermum erythrorhizon]|uniref:G-protein coupled receptor n=1 Tax=Lithospermum erythrorhizon TaxID=34254 RepID=A0AAV3PGT7_LITER
MGNKRVIYLALLIPLSFISKTTGLTMTHKVHSNSYNNRLIVFDQFRFTSSGQISINISSISIDHKGHKDSNSSSQHNSQLAFFLTSFELYKVAHQFDNHNRTLSCPSSKPFTSPLFSLDELSLKYNKIFRVTNPGVYMIYFFNCNPEKFDVSMTVHVETYNVNRYGDTEFLQDGFTQLPYLFLCFSSAYSLFVVHWMNICRKRRPFTYKIHKLILWLLIMKTIDLYCLGKSQLGTNVTGITPYSWKLSWHLFRYIRLLLNTCVIVFLGAGWSFRKPFLDQIGEFSLYLGLALQASGNMSYIKFREMPFFLLRDFDVVAPFYFCDCVCWLLSFGPIISSIGRLVKGSNGEAKATKNLGELKRLRIFLASIVVYLIVTRLGMHIVRYRFLHEYYGNWWVYICLELLVNFVFDLVTFHIFRPMQFGTIHKSSDEEALSEIHKSFIFGGVEKLYGELLGSPPRRHLLKLNESTRNSFIAYNVEE